MQGVKNIIPAFVLAFAILAMPSSSVAISSATGPEPWGQFEFDGLGPTRECVTCSPSPGNNSFPLGEPAWIFNGPGFLIVQDVGFNGDRFEVFDNNVSIGLTSDPVIEMPGCDAFDPEVCFFNNNSSHQIFTLGDFAHSFTISVVQAPFGSGAGFLCIDSGQGECGVPLNGDTDVPEPTSILLLGLGLAAGSFWARRHQLNLKFGLQRAFAWRSSRQRKKLI
jgi:hypothetical protein